MKRFVASLIAGWLTTTTTCLALDENDRLSDRLTPAMQHPIYSYLGKPDLSLNATFIAAGGGTKNFSSKKFIATLAGPLTNSEMKKLKGEFGTYDTLGALATFTYAVDHSLGIIATRGRKTSQAAAL